MTRLARPSGILPLTRQLGDVLDCRPVPITEPIMPPRRPSRRDMWPAETWAEMQRIYATPDPFEQSTNDPDGERR